MTFERTAEYDAFGPWILAVREPNDVPRVFRSHPFDFASTTVLKIPREISRRDANPSMHLYDRILVVDVSGLEVLTRDGDSFSVERIGSESIDAVEYGSDLLDGRLVVRHGNGGLLEIPYNSTSEGTISKIAEGLLLVDDRVGEAAAGAAGGEGAAVDGVVVDGAASAYTAAERLPLDALGVDDVALINAYRDLASRRPGLRVLALHNGSSPAPISTSLLQRLRFGRPRLSGAVIAQDSDLLVVLSRRHWYRRSQKPDLSVRRSFFSRSRILRISVSPDETARGVASVRFSLPSGEVELLMPADSVAATALPAAVAARDHA
jgi:hypothetical protein